MKQNLSFEFRFDKFVAALTYLASKVRRDFSKLRASKLLYFADRYHLINYGRPIIGDQYAKLPYGPVPSQALNLMNDLEHPIRFKGVHQPFLDELQSRLRVVVQGTRSTYVAITEPDLSALSASDIEALDKAIAKFGKMPVAALVEVGHQERAWKECTEHWIDYRLFFDENSPDQKAALEALEEHTENSSFLRDLADS